MSIINEEEKPELKELIEQFFSEEEDVKNLATQRLKDIGIFTLDDFLVEELNRIYDLPPLEFLEIYYQYFASTGEENPIREKPFLAQIESVQGLLFDCICYDLVHPDDELNEMVEEKLNKLVNESTSVDEKTTILKKLLTLLPTIKDINPYHAYPEKPRYWLYSDVIETLGKIGGKEAEEVLLDIVQGEFHHKDTKEEASKELEKIEEIRTLDDMITLEDFLKK